MNWLRRHQRTFAIIALGALVTPFVAQAAGLLGLVGVLLVVITIVAFLGIERPVEKREYSDH